jgi:hypothetical protein
VTVAQGDWRSLVTAEATAHHEAGHAAAAVAVGGTSGPIS